MRNNETGFIKWMTKEEFNILLSGLKHYELGFRLMFFIMFYMGLRRSEVCFLKWIDIVGNLQRLRITDVKNKEIRERVIPQIVKKEFEIYEFATKDFRTNKYVFQPRSRSGSKYPHIQPNSVSAKFKEIRDRLGLTDYYFIRKDGRKLYRISPHTCRHYFITKFYEKSGNDLILTQRVIGHSRPSTTAKYIFTNMDREAEIVETI